MSEPKPKAFRAPWMPAPHTDKEIRMAKAMVAGEASAEQQKDFLRFIIEVVCGYNDMSYRPESERDTCFAEGKRHVATTLVRLSHLLPSNINHPRGD